MKLYQTEKNIITNAANILYKVAAEKEFKDLKDSSIKSTESLYSKIITTINKSKEDY